MTNDLVERVARASFAWWKQQNSRAANFEDMMPDELEFALQHARFVIAEMRAFFSERANSAEFQADSEYELHTAIEAIDEALK